MYALDSAHVKFLPFLSTTVVEENGKVDPITNVSIVNDREVQSLTFARALMTKAENHHTAISSPKCTLPLANIWKFYTHFPNPINR